MRLNKNGFYFKWFTISLLVSFFLSSSCKKVKTSTVSTSVAISGLSSIVGATGDPITIYGSGFDPDPEQNKVLFGSQPAEVAVATVNRLTVIVPLLATPGPISVSNTKGSAVSKDVFSLVTVLRGDYNESILLTSNKKYLLRGPVVFAGKLSIEPGTVIFGEKKSAASALCREIDFEGSPTRPIIFTSDQEVGKRAPGDWRGLAISERMYVNSNSVPFGVMRYVRVEYAGISNATGTGLKIGGQAFPGNPTIGTGEGFALNLITSFNSNSDVAEYIQVSYSAGGGINVNSVNTFFIRNLVAFGCAGTDFQFLGGVIAQFALGLKNPNLADPSGADGLRCGGPFDLNNNNAGVLQYSKPPTLSNFTLVGASPAGRNLNELAALNQNAGRGVHVYPGVSTKVKGGLNLFNSVVASSWLAGLSIDGKGAWDIYDKEPFSDFDIVIRSNAFVQTAPPAFPQPFRGGDFGRENYSPAKPGFDDISSNPDYAKFARYNTLNLDPALAGIQGVTDYSNFQRPALLPLPSSVLLTAARFPDTTPASQPNFNKDVKFVGAFGTVDWSFPWCSFDPQHNAY